MVGFVAKCSYSDRSARRMDPDAFNCASAAALMAGEYASAKECIDKARDRAAEGSTDLLYAEGNEAMRLFLLEEYDAAIRQCESVQRQMTTALGKNHIDTVNIQYCKGLCHARLEQYDDAVDAFNATIHNFTGAHCHQAYVDLVATLSLQRRYEEACRHAEASYTACLAEYGYERSETFEAVDILVRVHCMAAEVLKLYDCAEEACAYARTAYELATGHDHRQPFEASLVPRSTNAQVAFKLMARVEEQCALNQSGRLKKT